MTSLGTSTGLTGVFAGRYILDRELGRGATAIVYLARDTQRGHPVAIKVLRQEFAESIGADRFLKEIRVSQSLHHPHILPVLDSGTYEHQLYFVLPHAEGGTLRARLAREKQLPLDDVVAITRTVATALAHAHDKGLIHRDVKPENILFMSGQACLGDFGIARALERALGDPTTSANVVRGTPAYMSPEQASGDDALDRRSDIYSLGCVIYEMIAGIQPFVGPSAESVMSQRLMHAPRPMQVFRRTLPTAVEGVVDRALSVSPADRFQTATELAGALEIAVRTPDDPVAGADRRRRLAIVTGAIAVGVVAVAAVIFAMRATPNAPGGLAAGDPRRIAVLYLDDLTPQTVPTYVADGITEDLIDELGSVSALNVISSYGTRPFRGSAVSMDSIARALKVGTIITGSIARSGGTLRLNVRLVNAITGQQLASLPLQEQWTGLFALQNTLVNRIAFTLRQRLGDQIGASEKRASTKSVAAWEIAQLANAELHRAEEVPLRAGPQKEHQFLWLDSLQERATQLDPSWDEPWLSRGRIALGLARFASLSPARVDSMEFRRLPQGAQRAIWFERAVTLSDEAMRRSPRSPKALALRGEARYELSALRLPGSDSLARLAERDLRSAIEIRSDPLAWSTLALLYISQGRFADAAAAAQGAYDADPFFEATRVISTAFFASLYSERYADARRWCRMGLDHYAGDERFTECEITLLGWTGKTSSDVAAAQTIVRDIERKDTHAIFTDTWGYRRLMVGAVLARSGMRDSARALLVSLHKGNPPDSLMRNTALGESYLWLLLRERDSSIAHLSAYLSQSPRLRAQVAEHPWFRPLRSDPRFAALVGPSR